MQTGNSIILLDASILQKQKQYENHRIRAGGTCYIFTNGFNKTRGENAIGINYFCGSASPF
jgi:hypothetical protein